MSSIFENVPN